MIILGSLESAYSGLSIVLIELFSLSVMADALRAIIGSKSAILLQWGPVDPKFQVEVVAPTNRSFFQKTGLNALLYGIKIWTDLFTVLSQCTRVTDKQTDGQTEFLSLDRVCIPCSAVKNEKNFTPHPFPSGAFGTSIFVPSALGVRVPFGLRLEHCYTHMSSQLSPIKTPG